uniref:Uncharacterized protein n=1 Tax=Anguilla anguilla TaxID=7936 RepID=A0A0E9QX98_ANGAN
MNTAAQDKAPPQPQFNIPATSRQLCLFCRVSLSEFFLIYLFIYFF